MNFIKKFSPAHYSYYLEHNIINSNNFTIEEWIKGITCNELIIWIRCINLFEKNDVNYYFEYSILLTLIIKLFITELDIESHSVKFSNKQLLELFNKFKNILFEEYMLRKNNEYSKKTNISLL